MGEKRLSKRWGNFSKIRLLDFSFARSNAFASVCLVVLISTLATGCFTTNFRLGSTKVTTTGGINVSDNQDNYLIYLSKVLRSNTNPATVFDLVGNGSGSIGKFCVAQGTDGTTAAVDIGKEGPSSCTCEYSFIKPDGTSQSFEVDTLYVESDLMRCSSAGIPPTVAYANVRIHVKSADIFSNSVTYKYSGSGALVDLTDPSSFVKAQRYQCRDAVFVPFMLDGNIYDPIASDAPDISYPLNYYTTNMGRAISDYVGLGFAQPTNGAGYLCPSLPNDSSAGLDLTMYSISPDSSGSKFIFPASQTSFDRSTFYLAKAPAGIFSIPFNVFVAPNTVTETKDIATGATPSGKPPSIGYGAASIPISDGQERCPNSNDGITIPSGFKWVKVWQFRASLASRTVKRSPNISSNTVSVACNAGLFSSGAPVTADCGATGGVTADSSGRIADRVLGSGVCINLSGSTGGALPICTDKNPATGVGCTTVASGAFAGQQKSSAINAGFADYSVFAPGSDIWKPVGTRACGGAIADTLNLCFRNYAVFPAIPGPVPFDTAAPTDLNIDGNVSRFDIVYTVSPPEVMSGNFKSSTTGVADAVGLVYMPYRYYSPVFCSSPDPDNPKTLPDGSRDCSPDKKIVYGFENKDATTAGGVNDPAASRKYPICALQPI